MQISICLTDPPCNGSRDPPPHTPRKYPYCATFTTVSRESTSFLRPTPHFLGMQTFTGHDNCLVRQGASGSVSGVQRDTLSNPCMNHSLSLLLTTEPQGGEWLRFDGLSGALILAPIGTVIDESRRKHALADRDLSLQSRGALPYWHENTLGLVARVQCIPEATIRQRGHWIRHNMNRRHWSVGSNRNKHLVVDSGVAARVAFQTVSCIHIWTLQSHLSRVPISRHCCPPCTASGGDFKKNFTFSGNVAPLATPLLQLYHDEDRCRIALGDLTLHHRRHLYLIYQTLSSPTVRAADANIGFSSVPSQSTSS